MSGLQSLIKGHMKICHHTFTFLMTGSTNPLKKWVGECSSLSTRRCQNYFVRQNCNSSSYTRVTSGESYGLEAVCICSWLQSSEDSANLASPCETQNWSYRPSFWEAQQSLYLYIVFDHFWEAKWYLYLVIIGKLNNIRIRSFLGNRIIFVFVFGHFWESE